MTEKPYGFYDHKRQDGKLGALAIHQLEEWRRYARRWVLIPEERTMGEDGYHVNGTEIHLVCHGLQYAEGTTQEVGGCGQSVFQLHDGRAYRYLDLETIEGLITGHIRNVHREIEHLVYSGG